MFPPPVPRPVAPLIPVDSIGVPHSGHFSSSLTGRLYRLHHAEENRALRLFMGARGTVTYEGEFELDSDQPYYRTDAPETGDGPLREVILFRMRPKDTQPRPPSSKLDAALADPRHKT